MACEDAQRQKRGREAKIRAELPITPSSTDDSWLYSTPVTVREFLDSLFRIPGGPHIKRKHIDKAQQSALVDGDKDSVPEVDTSFVDVFLSPALKVKSDDTRHLTNNKSQANIAKFLNSNIFFNHWIRTDDVLRPSVLVQAWNRNAAIMCESGATGIDFVIPVMMEWSHNDPQASKLGGCTTPWDEDQQIAASQLISYVLIQTKNRKSSTSGDRLAEMIDAVPLKRGLNKHPNFVDHEPQNPFLSVLFDFRVKPAERPSLELTWTRGTLEARHKNAVAKFMSIQKVVDKKIPGVSKSVNGIKYGKDTHQHRRASNPHRRLRSRWFDF